MFFDHAARIYHNGSAAPIIEDTLINDNTGPGVQGSRAELALSSNTSQSLWTFDFSSNLIWPIHHVRAVTASGVGTGFVSYNTSFTGKVLTVATSVPVTAVCASVDSSAFTSSFT